MRLAIFFIILGVVIAAVSNIVWLSFSKLGSCYLCTSLGFGGVILGCAMVTTGIIRVVIDKRNP